MLKKFFFWNQQTLTKNFRRIEPPKDKADATDENNVKTDQRSKQTNQLELTTAVGISSEGKMKRRRLVSTFQPQLFAICIHCMCIYIIVNDTPPAVSYSLLKSRLGPTTALKSTNNVNLFVTSPFNRLSNSQRNRVCDKSRRFDFSLVQLVELLFINWCEFREVIWDLF